MTQVEADGSGGESYSGKAARSAAWSAGAALGVRILRILAFFIMARIVSAEAFGILALAMAVVSVAQIAAGFGLHQYIIRAPTVTQRTMDSAFWMSAALGLALSLLIAGTAPLAALLIDESGATPIMLALSPLPLLAALSTVPTGVLWRELQYRSLAGRNLLAAGISVLVALVLAFCGFGIWSLVAQVLVEAAVGTVMLWVAGARHYRPGFTFSGPNARDGLSFGWRVVGGDLLSLTSYKADDVIVGAKLGAAALGTYSVAYRILTVMRETLQSTSGTVAFSFFSRLQDDPVRLRAAFVRATRANAAVAFPVFIFVAAAGPAVVDVTLGDRWEDCGPIVTALSLVGMAAAVTDMCLALLVAMGHPHDTFRFALWNTGANVVAFLVAVQFGVVWVAVAFSARAYLMLPLVLRMLRRRSGLVSSQVLRPCSEVLAACVGVAAMGLWSRSLSSSIGSFWALVATFVLALLIYVVALRLCSRASFDELAQVVRGLRERSPLKSVA